MRTSMSQVSGEPVSSGVICYSPSQQVHFFMLGPSLSFRSFLRQAVISPRRSGRHCCSLVPCSSVRRSCSELAGPERGQRCAETVHQKDGSCICSSRAQGSVTFPGKANDRSKPCQPLRSSLENESPGTDSAVSIAQFAEHKEPAVQEHPRLTQ